MKRIPWLTATFLLVFFAGCKQDIDLTADYKEVPVVYGLLNQQDNTHYIRIQKGYLIDGNALAAAGVGDSVYYPDVLSVKLLPFNSNGTAAGNGFSLTRVDGDLLGLPKPTGTFANSPNWLYSFTGSLDPAKTYRLQVTNNSNGFSFGSKKDKDNRDISLIKDFVISNPHKADRVNLQNLQPLKAVWTSAENAGVYDLTIRFHYKEYAAANNALLKDTFVDILLFKSVLYDYTGGSLPPFEVTSDNVLNYLAHHIVATSDVYREFNIKKGMQFKFAAGGTELATFINSQTAQGGLASNEALSPYTNIENGVGLLSSRYFKQIDSVLLSNNALDSLACSDITRGLRFKNHSGLVCQ